MFYHITCEINNLNPKKSFRFRENDDLALIVPNVFVYGLLRGLARNLANKNRIENP